MKRASYWKNKFHCEFEATTQELLLNKQLLVVHIEWLKNIRKHYNSKIKTKRNSYFTNIFIFYNRSTRHLDQVDYIVFMQYYSIICYKFRVLNHLYSLMICRAIRMHSCNINRSNNRLWTFLRRLELYANSFSVYDANGQVKVYAKLRKMAKKLIFAGFLTLLTAWN